MAPPCLTRVRRAAFAAFAAVSILAPGRAAGSEKALGAALLIRVRDSRTGAPLAASVDVRNGEGVQLLSQAAASEEGEALLTQLPEQVWIRCSAQGHAPLEASFSPPNGALLPVTFWLDSIGPDENCGQLSLEERLPPGSGAFWGIARDLRTLAPLEGVRLRFEDGGPGEVTDERGFFWLSFQVEERSPDELPPLAALAAEKEGYKTVVLRDLWREAGSCRLLLDMEEGEGSIVREEGHKLLLAARDRLPGGVFYQPSEAREGEAEIEESLPSPALTVVDPPNLVRVGMSCSCTACSSVDVLSLESYVKRGLNDEWISSWTANSLRAGAVAYRSYGAYYALHPINANYDICSTTCCQVNDTDTAASTNSAADATSGFMLQRSGAVFRSEYSAENNAWDDPGDGLACVNGDLSCGDGWAGSPSTSWPCLSDSPCAGRGCFGHGRGECQWGTSRWAGGSYLKDWAWITNHYYNDGGSGSGYRTAYLTSPCAIASATPSPASVAPGGTLTIAVSASNYAEATHAAILIGASIYSAASGYISDPSNDAPVTLSPGTNSPNRPFTVPSGTADGLYDLIASLWYDVNGDGAIGSGDIQLTSLTNAGAVTVAGTGTCASPIPILSFPFSDSNTTLGRASAVNGYSCPPSSGSEAGPEAVYSFTLSEPGNLTVTVTDASGVDIDPHLLSSCNPAACLARNDTTFTASLYPGSYTLICDTWTSTGGTQYPGAYSLTVTFVSTAGDTVSPAEVQNLKWNAALVRWEWNTVTQNRLGGAETIASYQVWRSTDPAASGALLGTTAGTSWGDSATPGAGICWFYSVRAVDSAGNRDGPVLDRIADNPEAAFAGTWGTGDTTPGFWGADYRFHATGGGGAETASWGFTPDETGLYEVSVYYCAFGNRSTEARFGVTHAGGSAMHLVNQQASGGTWVALSSRWLLAGTPYSITLDDAEPGGFYVVADAVRWRKP